jgi:hypothetical protein
MFCRISSLQCKGETRVKQCWSCLFQNETNVRVKYIVMLVVEDVHYCHLKQYRITYELHVNNVTAAWHNGNIGRVFLTPCQVVVRPYTGSYTLHCYIFEVVINSFVYFKAWPETSRAVIFVLYECITYLFYADFSIFLFWIASIKTDDDWEMIDCQV